MAKQVNLTEHNGNQEKIDYYENKIFIAKIFHLFALFIILFGIYDVICNSLYFIETGEGLIFFGIGFVFILIGQLIQGDARQRIPALKAGIQGEEEVANYLSDLSDEYIVLNNVSIQAKSQQTEIDSLVISRYGIWIVETKNYSGYLSGRVDDRKWQRERISQYGVSREDEVNNPLRQMHRQIWILKEVLKANHIRTYIHGIVILPSAQQVTVDSDEVVLDKENLLEKIESERRAILTNNDLRKILMALGLKVNS